MPFDASERAELLKVKGIGPTVVKRLEEIGITSFDQLSRAKTTDVVAQAAAMLGASCWKNSPQARATIVPRLRVLCCRAPVQATFG